MFSGTDVHKRVIKQKYCRKRDLEETTQLLWKFLTDALFLEIKGDMNEEVFVADLVETSRRVILRALSYEMIGTKVVEIYNTLYETDFVTDFMVFQDLVEECTAKAAVCPAWLSSILFLKDCENHRLGIVSRLESAMRQAIDTTDHNDVLSLGRWFVSVYDMKDKDDNRLYNFDDIADFSVGLMFAARTRS